MGRNLYQTTGVLAYRAWGSRIEQALQPKAGKVRRLRGAELAAFARQRGVELSYRAPQVPRGVPRNRFV